VHEKRFLAPAGGRYTPDSKKEPPQECIRTGLKIFFYFFEYFFNLPIDKSGSRGYNKGVR